MPVYNRCEGALLSMNSIVNQSLKDWVLFVINDESTDDFSERIQPYLKDSRIIYIEQKNKGLTRTLRDFFETTNSEFIAIQGPGDISAENRLQCQLDFLIQKPEYGAVGSKYRTRYSDGNLRKQESVYKSCDEAKKDLLSGANPFSHGELMFRREAVIEVGNYRSKFKYSQDYDLLLRLAKSWKLGMINESLYTRIATKDGVTENFNKRFKQLVLAAIALQEFKQDKKNKSQLTLNEDCYIGIAEIFTDNNPIVDSVMCGAAVKYYRNSNGINGLFMATRGYMIYHSRRKLINLACKFLVIGILGDKHGGIAVFYLGALRRLPLVLRGKLKLK